MAKTEGWPGGRVGSGGPAGPDGPVASSGRAASSGPAASSGRAGSAGPAGASLALGLDIGGTSTRAIVIDGAGRRLGSGRADGANVTSHALEKALDAVSAALTAALASVDPAQVGAAVIATAGDHNLTRPEVAERFAALWTSAGLNCGYRVVPDAVGAFVAGTAAPDGTLVLSGTGAITVRFADRAPAQLVDGHGWLLGDLGSGFWLGREAVRRTIDTIDRCERPGPLGRAVVQTLTGATDFTLSRATTNEVVLAVHRRPPVALSSLAPLVTANAGVDPEADRILAAAADHLLTGAGSVRSPDDATPIVLAGSLLTGDTPLAALVRGGLTERWPHADVRVALDGAAGAAWLAARSLDPDGADRLHAALFG
ncbi:N-acetylglucosamine kinase [Jiangella muralis]|uniref:N-acetylglucosamine kinase n=1 Tax=Jiangella muralis TaxID=702383 RepID=UPI001969D686|nr:BadF/BadG/BcrA/BcrD ATPase family protein [Jiangella muralis]